MTLWDILCVALHLGLCIEAFRDQVIFMSSWSVLYRGVFSFHHDGVYLLHKLCNFEDLPLGLALNNTFWIFFSAFCCTTSWTNWLLILHRALFDNSYKYLSVQEQWMSASRGMEHTFVIPDRSSSPQGRAKQNGDGTLWLAQWRGNVFVVKHRSWKKSRKKSLAREKTRRSTAKENKTYKSCEALNTMYDSLCLLSNVSWTTGEMNASCR